MTTNDFRKTVDSYKTVSKQLGHFPTKSELEKKGKQELITQIQDNGGFNYIRKQAAKERAKERQEALFSLLEAYVGKKASAKTGIDSKIQANEFFDRGGNIDELARDVVGSYFVRKLPSGLKATVLLTEVIPFAGIAKTTHQKDCMSYRAGVVWVNDRYGNKLVNIACGNAENPACILLKGGIAKIGYEKPEVLDGPGKLAHKLRMNEKLTGSYIGQEGLKLERGNLRDKDVEIVKQAGMPGNCLGIYRLK